MKRHAFLTFILAICLAMCMAITGCNLLVGNPDEDAVKVTSVSVNPKSCELILGSSTQGSIQLGADVYPANATNKSVTWTSGNEGIVTVENGLVTAVSMGITTVIVKP